MNKTKIYDIVIIGAGPAGLTAAVYALRSGRSVAVIEKLMVGGQVALTNEIKNYPGFINITGFDLSMLMHRQAQELGAESIFAEVLSLDVNNKIKIVKTTMGDVLGKSIIVATGAKSKKLKLENEEKLTGHGIGYCAVCDGAFYKGKNVVLTGGGNSGVEDAIYLSKIVKSLTIISLYDNFTAQQILVDELHHTISEYKNTTIHHNSKIVKISGDSTLQSVEFENLKTGKKTTVDADGLFVTIGRAPDTEFLKDIVVLDKWGYVVANEDLQTSVPGVFVAGDVRQKKLRQIVTAAADGAIAATNCNNYLNANK